MMLFKLMTLCGYFQMRELLDQYKAVYDVLILYDGSMDFVNTLVQQIITGKAK